MLTRNQARAREKQKACAEAKARLTRLGWSYRRAAPLLNVHHVHLANVLRGERESWALLARIAHLPPCPADEIPHNSPRRQERAA